MSGAGDEYELRVRYGARELSRHGRRGTRIVLAPDEQRRDRNSRQDIAEVRLGHSRERDPDALAADVGSDGGEQFRRIFRRLARK
jgi:hypothetical protein